MSALASAVDTIQSPPGRPFIRLAEAKALVEHAGRSAEEVRPSGKEKGTEPADHEIGPSDAQHSLGS